MNTQKFVYAPCEIVIGKTPEEHGEIIITGPTTTEPQKYQELHFDEVRHGASVTCYPDGSFVREEPKDA